MMTVHMDGSGPATFERHAEYQPTTPLYYIVVAKNLYDHGTMHREDVRTRRYYYSPPGSILRLTAIVILVWPYDLWYLSVFLSFVVVLVLVEVIIFEHHTPRYHTTTSWISWCRRCVCFYVGRCTSTIIGTYILLFSSILVPKQLC
jgi:hypothetical protein